MITTAPYRVQEERWPRSGRVILAQYDANSVVVYQAYRPSIGKFAASHGYFGGEFSFNRMSWIKPNFLWMMYRSGWGTKEGQETTLAVRIQRAGFESILAAAVHSSFDAGAYASHESWQQRVANSDVRLQWDPDHDPHGRPLERRAIQLGLRGEFLARYARDWIVDIIDCSAFVAEMRARLDAGGDSELETPVESTYLPADPRVIAHLGLEQSTGDGLAPSPVPST